MLTKKSTWQPPLPNFQEFKENIIRYLFLTYYRKPDGKIDEVLSLSTRVRTKDWQTVNVILDFKDLKVLKAHMEDKTVPKEWERVVSFYYQHYPATIERLLQENGYQLEEASEEVAQQLQADNQPA